MSKKRKAVFIACISVMVLAVAFIGWYFLKEDSNSDIYEELQNSVVKPQPEEKPPVNTNPVTPPDEDDTPVEPPVPDEPYESPIDWQQLWDVNEEIYAWIDVPDTDVHYPVAQHPEDNAYYLNYTIEGNAGLPGAIFSETYNSQDFSDFLTVLYGHNMKNNSMFGGLDKYRDEEYFDQHRDIVVYTPEAEYHYKVFAAVVYSSVHLLKYYDTTVESDKQAFIDSLSNTKNLSSHVVDDVEVTPDSKLIVMSTCIGNQPKNRYLVVGVMVDPEEDVTDDANTASTES